jgi:hypothetical protein
MGKPVHVFAGRLDAPGTPGVRFHEISPRGTPLAEALPRTGQWLREKVKAVFLGGGA